MTIDTSNLAMLFLGCAIAGSSALVRAYHVLARIRDSDDWIVTEGRVTFSSVEYVDDEQRVKITVSWDVNGHTYSSDIDDDDGSRQGLPTGAHEICAAYPIHRKVPVRHHPSNPAMGVASTAQRRGAWTLTTIAVVSLLTAAWAFAELLTGFE